MRCALSFDEDRDLSEQEVSAWGAMQPLSEEPAYKESEIESETDKEYFAGYKAACDMFCREIIDLLEGGAIEESVEEHLERIIQGEIVMQLFSIIDNQVE